MKYLKKHIAGSIRKAKKSVTNFCKRFKYDGLNNAESVSTLIDDPFSNLATSSMNPPIILRNLLPYDISFEITGPHTSRKDDISFTLTNGSEIILTPRQDQTLVGKLIYNQQEWTFAETFSAFPQLKMSTFLTEDRQSLQLGWQIDPLVYTIFSPIWLIDQTENDDLVYYQVIDETNVKKIERNGVDESEMILCSYDTIELIANDPVRHEWIRISMDENVKISSVLNSTTRRMELGKIILLTPPSNDILNQGCSASSSVDSGYFNPMNEFSEQNGLLITI